MSDQTATYPGQMEPAAADLEAATRRLMVALDALESAVERRREADRDEDELASRIQALGADRSRLAHELDGSLVKSRKLERTNREIAERLDVAIVTIREVLGVGEDIKEALKEGSKENSKESTKPGTRNGKGSKREEPEDDAEDDERGEHESLLEDAL